MNKRQKKKHNMRILNGICAKLRETSKYCTYDFRMEASVQDQWIECANDAYLHKHNLRMIRVPSDQINPTVIHAVIVPYNPYANPIRLRFVEDANDTEEEVPERKVTIDPLTLIRTVE